MKFSRIYPNFIPKYEIQYQLNNSEADPNDTAIPDTFFNTPELLYDFLGITSTDLQITTLPCILLLKH